MTSDPLAWLRPYLAPPAPRRVASEDVRVAVAAFNQQHGRDWGAAGSGTCPICGHRACFGEARGKLTRSGRWACFSANHGNIGVKLGACVHGDALDIEAFQAGRSRIDHLRALGFLKAPDGKRRLTRADVVRALGHEPDESEIEFLEERAGIRTFDGGQSLFDAECGALADLLRVIERERQARHA